MLNTYERHVITGYLSNMANRFDRESPEASGVVEWLTENASLLGFDRRSFDLDSEPFDSKEEMSAKQWRVCRRILDQAAETTVPIRYDRLMRRLRRLGRIIRLSAEEISVLQLLLRYQTQPEFEDLLDTVVNGRRRRFHHSALNLKNRLTSAALGISTSTFRRRLADDAPLVRSGLVIVDDDQDISSLERLRSMVWGAGSQMDVRKLLLGATRPTELEWSDFDHLGQPRSDVENLLQGALNTGKRGVNVLIHGPPGTGKTEFCRVLAKRMDVEMFSIGEADAAGGEPTRTERLGELRLAQSLLGRDSGSLLLFDEMDDLLSEEFHVIPSVRDAASPAAEGRHVQGVHESPAGGQRDADPMDHQRSPRHECHHSAAHDLCAGDAPAAAAHPGTDLGASTGAARY